MDLSKMLKADLVKLATEKGIKTSGLSKADLVAAIEAIPVPAPAPVRRKVFNSMSHRYEYK